MNIGNFRYEPQTSNIFSLNQTNRKHPPVSSSVYLCSFSVLSLGGKDGRTSCCLIPDKAKEKNE